MKSGKFTYVGHDKTCIEFETISRECDFKHSCSVHVDDRHLKAKCHLQLNALSLTYDCRRGMCIH